MIETGIATTLSLGSDARLAFLESYVNFNFVGPICDSIGVERVHLLNMSDFSERAQSIEVTNGLILELSNFATREKIAPIVLVTWLRNFNTEFCKDGNTQKAYKALRSKIKKLKLYHHNCENRSQRRNAVMENLLQSPFELVVKKEDARRCVVKKRVRKDDLPYERMIIKEEEESYEIMPVEESKMYRGTKKIMLKESDSVCDANDEDLEAEPGGDKTSVNHGEALNLLDIAMLSVEKLSSVYNGKNTACKQVSMVLLKNQYALTCKEHPAMEEFEKKLNLLSENISLVSPVVFLHANANFLVDLHDAVEKQIMAFEKEITESTGQKLGRDRLPEFKNFVNMSESATARYINMACDILSPRTSGKRSYRRHWVAFCDEKNNPSRLAANASNRFKSYFETSAGLIHHHKEIPLFFSDLLSLNDTCPNVVLASLAADANDSVIQTLVCVLAIVYCKILGPYWQLLKSVGEYSLFSQYVLCLYQKFLNWSKDPSTLLEPEGAINVFLQCPLQEKTFAGVFQYCSQWHANGDLIRTCLKRVIKTIAAVSEEHLKDFLPGGTFSEVPSPDLSLQLGSCTFSVLMADYPFSFVEEKKTVKSSKQLSQKHLLSSSSSSDSSQEGSSDNSFDDTTSLHSPDLTNGSKYEKKGKEPLKRKAKKEVFENMDKDYIIATVEKNGGPCKSQQDVDKLMLRFDGKSRVERREGIRCEILYQKMVLNNTDPNLNCAFANFTQMGLKLKLALPRVKPGFSLVLAPRKTKAKPVTYDTEDVAAALNETSTLDL